VSTAVRYTLVRTLRTWLWLIVAVVALAGAFTGFALVYGGWDSDYAVLAASGAAVLGAILFATPYLVVIAMLSLVLEIAESVSWITNYLYDRVEADE
jgi:uncharacterized membrane protein